jgi:RNA polymerase sigma-70 factor (ECF subfamily)
MEGSNPAGYLYRAATNGALNLIRSRRRLEFTGDAERLEFPLGSTTSSAAEDLHGRLTETIGELRPDDAQILILRYVQGHTDGEIAQLLGVSRGTIVMRLFRSRLRLKRLMRDEMEDEK